MIGPFIDRSIILTGQAAPPNLDGSESCDLFKSNGVGADPVHTKTQPPEDIGMKAKKKILTAAALSAFLALAGAVQAQDTGGDKTKTRNTSGKKATHYRRSHKGGKKGHRRHRKSKKGSSGPTTPPPK
jgi:hypothetical protein